MLFPFSLLTRSSWKMISQPRAEEIRQRSADLPEPRAILFPDQDLEKKDLMALCRTLEDHAQLIARRAPRSLMMRQRNGPDIGERVFVPPAETSVTEQACPAIKPRLSVQAA